MSVKQEIKKFIIQNYLFTEDENAIADDVSLLKTGTLDSTGVLELIMFLEENLGIKVAEEEMVPANLDSIDSIAAFVTLKKAG